MMRTIFTINHCLMTELQLLFTKMLEKEGMTMMTMTISLGKRRNQSMKRYIFIYSFLNLIFTLLRVERILSRNPARGFEGAEKRAEPRTKPVEFEKHVNIICFWIEFSDVNFY